MSLSYYGERLRTTNPVPTIINFIKNNPGIENHHKELFTILTELYVNAIDHGVLGLDSKLKETAEGFSQYFLEREERLAQLKDGFVHITLNTSPREWGGRITIRIEDSGPGFNYQKEIIPSNPTIPSGRGIKLAKELCESLQHQGSGNTVEAIYDWKN